MSWRVRDSCDINGYLPQECPNYSFNPDMFTIKLYSGGDLNENCSDYLGGEIRYIDYCDMDHISYIEIKSMYQECGNDMFGSLSMYYKLPGTDSVVGVWPLEDDEDVMEMCALLPSDSRVVYVYAVVKPQRSVDNILLPENWTQNYPPTQACDDVVDEETRKQIERANEVLIYELEGMNKDFTDIANSGEEAEPDLTRMPVIEEVSDGSVKSWHKDSSNDDSTDEDKESEGEGNIGKEIGSNDEGDGSDTSESSKYIGSDDERMAANSTDEDEMSFPLFNEAQDMADPQFEVGMMFSTAKVFRDAVRKHAIVHRKPILQKRNYGSRVKFICSEGCEWLIYASKMQNSDTYQVKHLVRKHTCTATFFQKQMKSPWIAKFYENEIRMNPSWPISAFQQKVVNDWNCDVSIYAISRAKKKALETINGKHADQYALVHDYKMELLRVMPDSTILIETEEKELGQQRAKFKRMYIFLGPIKRGFKNGCRPLIGLDGCHLKGPFGGQMLAAVGTDGNDGMYPLAWAVVEAETTETWHWFLETLRTDLEIDNDGGWTFISDRQKGLINALEAVVPSAEHRFCVMHLYRNMWKEHKGIGVRMCLWKAARATTEYMFNKSMEELKKLSKKCHIWLNEKPRSQWTRSAFRIICKSDMFVNNHCEVFNSTIRKYRHMPILSMLKAIHKSVMIRIQRRRDKMMRSYALNPICPNAMRRLHKAIEQSGGCDPVWSGGARYSVAMTGSGHEMVVDLDAHACACRKWQMSGIPCYHACACIGRRQLQYEGYIHQCYTKDAYLQCYKEILEPICGEEAWGNSGFDKPLPPSIKVQPGRPKKKRSKVNDIPADATKLRRQNTTTKCSYCLEFGHNYAGCDARKNDEKAGVYKQVKRRIKKSKGKQSNDTSCDETLADATTAPISNVGPTNVPNNPSYTMNDITITGTHATPRTKKPTTKGKEKVPSTGGPTKRREKLVPVRSVSIVPQIPTPTLHVDAGSQGGIFRCNKTAPTVSNTPLGIQPERFNVKGKCMTSLKQLELARKQRHDIITKKPLWKL